MEKWPLDVGDGKLLVALVDGSGRSLAGVGSSEGRQEGTDGG